MDISKLKKTVDDLVKKLPEKERDFFNTQLSNIKEAVKNNDEKALLKISEKARKFSENA